MATKKTVLARAAAGIGALALALGALVATSSAAYAAQGTDGTPPGEAADGTTGTLVITKYAGSPTDLPHNGTEQSTVDRPVLPGVKFTVTPVTAIDGLAIDLNTPEGWDRVAAYTQTPPAGLTLGTALPEETTDANGQITVAGLPVALYLVTETGTPTGVTPAVPFLVTIPYPSKSGAAGSETTNWLWTVNTYPKNTIAPDAGKTVADPNAHGLGSLVPWTITTRPIGSFDGGAPITTYILKDTLNANLQYEATTSLQYRTAPGGALAAVDSTYYTIDPAAAATTPGGDVTVTFNTPGIAWLNTLPAGSSLEWKLTTKVVGVGELDNKVFENTGGDDVQTGTAITKWGAAKLLKHETNNENKVLAGAEFQVFNVSADGTCPATKPTTGEVSVLDPTTGTSKTVFVSDTNGVVNIPGLYVSKANEAPAERVYCVYETKAPAGYTLVTTPIAITVTPGAVAAGTWNEKVPNPPVTGPALPLTGGAGTLALTIGGLLIIAAGAATILVSRHRRKAADQHIG